MEPRASLKTIFLIFLVHLCVINVQGISNFEVEEIFKRLGDAEYQIALLKKKDIRQQDVISKLRTIVSQQSTANGNLQANFERQAKKIVELQKTVDQQSTFIADLQKTMSERYGQPSNVKFQEAENATVTSDHSGVQANHDSNIKGGAKRIAKRLPEEAIAFFARKTSTQSNIGVSQHIHFDNVPINKGSGYHAQQGLFIAPQSGLYLVSSSLLSLHTSHLPVHANIVHNGHVVARIYAHADIGAVNYDQGSNTVLVDAQQGDEIWIENFAAVSEVYGGYYSTFSGYLLWPY